LKVTVKRNDAIWFSDLNKAFSIRNTKEKIKYCVVGMYLTVQERTERVNPAWTRIMGLLTAGSSSLAAGPSPSSVPSIVRFWNQCRNQNNDIERNELSIEMKKSIGGIVSTAPRNEEINTVVLQVLSIEMKKSIQWYCKYCPSK
jgi:hypothetical protein